MHGYTKVRYRYSEIERNITMIINSYHAVLLAACVSTNSYVSPICGGWKMG